MIYFGPVLVWILLFSLSPCVPPCVQGALALWVHTGVSYCSSQGDIKEGGRPGVAGSHLGQCVSTVSFGVCLCVMLPFVNEPHSFHAHSFVASLLPPFGERNTLQLVVAKVRQL